MGQTHHALHPSHLDRVRGEVADTIRTATDESGERVHIDKATTGLRYRGLGAHEGCLLYPVHRSSKRSSFAHLPNRAHCLPPKGESAEHKRAKGEWADYLRGYLNPCTGCSSWGSAAPNLHLASCQRPFFADIAWFCDLCLRPHLYELPSSASDVAVERAFLGGAVRPDITIVDGDGGAVAFMEFKKSHLSPRIAPLAREHAIPLFVIDVSCEQNQRRRLYNPGTRWYDDVEGLDDEAKSKMRLVDALPGTYFSVLPSRNGKAVPTMHHIPNPDGEAIDLALPTPHFGHYLLADWSTLGCDSQQVWLDKALSAPGLEENLE